MDSLDGGSTLTLANLEGCFVDLLPLAGTLSTLFLHSLARCVVLAPDMAGSAMLHSCSGCVIVLGAHQVCRWCIASLTAQLRLHDSVETDLHLYTTSVPIIERCDRLRFASYPTSLGSAESAVRLQRSSTSLIVQTSSHASAQDFDDPLAVSAASSSKWSPIPVCIVDARSAGRFGLDALAAQQALPSTLSSLLP